MSEHFQLELRPVGALINTETRFFIPDYQRGYRWEDAQVNALLNDLAQFEREFERGDQTAFYCLQPLVVVKRDNDWEVVDGQQRLTTLFLILKHLNNGNPPYFIQYQRHPEHIDGLDGLLARHSGSENAGGFLSPDLYYLQQARVIIANWTKQNPESLQKILHSVKGCCAKFIWYEVDRQAAIKTFSNLNAGKIQLTDAELIRALFLRKNELPEAERQRIALRWDQIERRLQDPEFWAFLSKDKTTENRIGLLFALTADRTRSGKGNHASRNVFTHVFERAGASDGLTGVWKDIEEDFAKLEEWYSADHLFHLVGLLIMQGETLRNILDAERDCAKRSHFQNELKRRVFRRIFGKDTRFDQLEGRIADATYGNSKQTREILLCLNIATLHSPKSSANDYLQRVRLSFDGYKSRSWDIEHIRATASAESETVEQLEFSLRAIEAYWQSPDRTSTESRSSDIDAILKSLRKIDGETKTERKTRLQDLYETLCKKLEGSDADLGASDGLMNLTLLPAETNRRIGAHPFPVKRAEILKRDSQGVYLLPCTRLVFTKSITPEPASLIYWNPSDADNYLDFIKTTLGQFFAELKDDPA